MIRYGWDGGIVRSIIQGAANAKVKVVVVCGQDVRIGGLKAGEERLVYVKKPYHIGLERSELVGYAIAPSSRIGDGVGYHCALVLRPVLVAEGGCDIRPGDVRAVEKVVGQTQGLGKTERRRQAHLR